MEPRNIPISSKITETLHNQMTKVFIESGNEFNYSEQVWFALLDYHRKLGDDTPINRRNSVLLSGVLEANTLQYTLQSIKDQHEIVVKIQEICVFIRLNPKEVKELQVIESLARLLSELQADAQDIYDSSHKIAKKLLSKGQYSFLIDCLTIGIPESSSLSNKEKIKYIGGTLDNDNPESEIMEMINNCKTVPKGDMREYKIHDTIGIIQAKYPEDKVHQLQVMFENGIIRMEEDEHDKC